MVFTLAGLDPRWLLAVGVAAWLLTIYLGWESITGLKDLFA